MIVHKSDNLSVVILAGGLGTRLRPVVSDRQKVIAEIHGKPFLYNILDQLIKAEITEVILCTGYLGNQVQAAIGERYKSIIIRYSQENEPLGTGGAIIHARHLFSGKVILVMNGDSYCNLHLSKFINSHLERTNIGSLVVTWVPDIKRYGHVKFDKFGNINAFFEKGAHSGPGWINAGIYLLSTDLFQNIEQQYPISIERDLFPRWIQKGLYAYQSRAKFLDIGLPETYLKAQTFFYRESTNAAS
ncbi:MAG TPA: nucleotidyltransferase family protein [Anaerolineaceae bacterium]